MTSHGHARTTTHRTRSARDLRTWFRRCSAGDARAREAIIVHFLPYARHLARRYMGRGEPLEDLYQAASVGLVKAVDRYRPERGDPFLAFAKATILGEVRRHFRETAWSLHVPRSVKDRARRVAKAERELGAKLGRPPSAELIARHLGLQPGEVDEARGALMAYRMAPLDASDEPGEGPGAAKVATLGAVDPEYDRIETRLGFFSALPSLPAPERKAILLRIAAEHTQSEIASRIGVSQMQVSRLLRNATPAMAAALELPVGGGSAGRS